MTARPTSPNLRRLASAAATLAPLLSRIVFVGGCITELLLTDPAAAPVRPTLDVDAIIALASYVEFTALARSLAELGFHHSAREGDPICRWLKAELVVDLMPTDPLILGFGNRWYSPALRDATALRLEDHEIRVITAPYFLATKLEAFHGRGKNEFQLSHDLEDIITIIDGRRETVEEVSRSPADLRKYLAEEFRSLLANQMFRDALPGHLRPDAASQQRISIVAERIQQIIDRT